MQSNAPHTDKVELCENMVKHHVNWHWNWSMNISVCTHYSAYAVDITLGRVNFMCWRLRSDLPLFRLWRAKS